jgi:hypothetical protein
MESKFIALSSKSLAIVWAWVEDNPQDALAKAYYKHCETLAILTKRSEIFDEIYQIHKSVVNLSKRKTTAVYRRRHKARCEWYVLIDSAYQARDTVGRIILSSMLKPFKVRKMNITIVVVLLPWVIHSLLKSMVTKQ